MFTPQFKPYSLTPFILLAFAILWAYPFYLAPGDVPVSEWFSSPTFSDSRIIETIIWPIVFMLLHLIALLGYLLRGLAPRCELSIYLFIVGLMSGVAICYVAMYGAVVHINPLPFIILLNLFPLVLIIVYAYRIHFRPHG